MYPMSKVPINLRMSLMLCALLTSGAYANTLRIGMPGLPAQRGQPYGGIYILALWTLGASYDPLTKLRAEGSARIQAQAEYDPLKRRALLNQIMARSHDQAQAIFIYEGVGFMGLVPRVKELPSDFGFIRFDEVRLKN
jgi:hypothetical protein